MNKNVELILEENFINIKGLLDYQKEVLNCLVSDKNVILNLNRQTGKTTIGRLWFLCSAIKYSNSKFFIISSSRRNSVIILEDLYQLLKEFCDKYNLYYIRNYNRTTINLTNGTSISIHDLDVYTIWNVEFTPNDFIFLDELEECLNTNSNTNQLLEYIFSFNFNILPKIYFCFTPRTGNLEKLLNSVINKPNWQYFSKLT